MSFHVHFLAGYDQAAKHFYIRLTRGNPPPIEEIQQFSKSELPVIRDGLHSRHQEIVELHLSPRDFEIVADRLTSGEAFYLQFDKGQQLKLGFEDGSLLLVAKNRSRFAFSMTVDQFVKFQKYILTVYWCAKERMPQIWVKAKAKKKRS